MTIPGPFIVTTRLALRPFEAADADRFAEIAGTPRVAEAMISVPYPMSVEKALAQIAGFHADRLGGRAVTFAITRKEAPERCVGMVAVRHIDPEHGEGELSFWIGEAEEGGGIVTEAASAALDYAFTTLQLNRVCAFHMVRNAASAHVLAKIGMVQEGYLRQRVRKRGVYEDVLVWAVLRRDWHRSG